MEPLRLRLKFDDTGILSKSQELDGLKRSWVLVEARHRTISDVVSHLLHNFDLWDSCPNGILLSMNGFVLPHFESTAILKDKDLVCVRRKGFKLFDVINGYEGEKTTVEQKVVEKLPVISDVLLLPNEEFEKETGGYQSETEEDEDKSQSDLLHVDNTPNGDASTKKRKASKQLKTSKRKRQRENDHSAKKEHDSVCLQNGDCQKKSSKSKRDQAQTPEDAGKDRSVVKRMCSSVEIGEGTVTPSSVPDGTVKAPASRSARRKKAKRQWLRALRVAEKEQLLEKQSQGENLDADVSRKDQNLNAEDHPEEPDDDSEPEGEIVPVVVRPGHIRFAASGKEKDVQQYQEAKESFNWHGIVNKKKGQKWGKEKQSSSKQNEHKAPNKKQSASKWNEHRSTQETQPASKRNEYRSSEKTQLDEFRSPEDRQAGSRWNDYRTRSRNWATQKTQPANASMDYEKLVPMTDFPVQGDTIAYRLLELSSAFCPELTSYRVGKVSWFDSESNRVMLVPVPEYPFEFKKAVDDTSEELPDSSHYKEDGSLEIDFPSLADVRIVKPANLNPGTSHHHGANKNPASGWNPTSGSGWRTESPMESKDPKSEAQPTSNKWTGTNTLASAPASTPASGWGSVSGSGWRTGTSVSSKDPPSQEQPASNNWTGPSTSTAPENGNKDVWEEISSALSAKKAELLKEDNWNKKRKSANRLWSHRTLRSSALGPTMALIRGQSNIETS